MSEQKIKNVNDIRENLGNNETKDFLYSFDNDTNYADGHTLDYSEIEVKKETLEKILNYYLK